MRKLATLLCLTIFGNVLFAQDISVIAITQPVSGCALTTTENVTIRIFNYGPTLMAGSTFDVSYIINGGGPVVETVTLGANLNTNSTLNYTFTTQADLSVPGAYVFDASTALPGDVNPTNDAFTGYSVTNTAPSVGGTITGPSSVCVTSNSGNLTLSGHTGNVQQWEYSTDGGFTWITIGNTSTTQPYNNLTVPTRYRVAVQSGGCAVAYSSILVIAIDQPSVGGSITPANSTGCSGANSGTLTLGPHTGSVVRWEFSTDGGLTWTNIANTTSTQGYTNLTQTTIYRAFVMNGSCTGVYSANATVTIFPPTVGGTINPVLSTVCSGSNSGTLTLSGHTGNVTRWEFSLDGGMSWSVIANTTTTQAYTNLTASRLYRARIQSGPCAVVYSTTATINVVANSIGGSVTPASSSACSGSNSGTLTLSGHTGSVLMWQFSTDGGMSWTNVANTTTTQAYNNIVATTMYRAQVQSGGCAAAFSSAATVTVSPVSVGGTVSGGVSVCASGNSGTLTLAGQTGSVSYWQSSDDGGVTWTNIPNLTTSQGYTNLTDTTIYRVVVTSGVCPADTSVPDTVIVDPVTVGGAVLPAMDTVCSGSNTGTLTLSAQTGSVVRWEYSTDGGLTWINISNTSTSQGYTNINTATLYRALVQSGLCTAAYSATATVTVDQPSAGGTLYGSATVCSGSNSGTITLIGNNGAIQFWESSTDGGATWLNIANTTNNENYLGLTDTTMYRSIVINGVCPADTSTLVTILVDEVSLGGTVTVDDTVCSGSNSGALTLSGHRGTVDGWDYSTDGGLTWINISNYSTTQNYLNLTTTTMYRARVHNGVCSPVTSIEATITVDPPATGGTVLGSMSVCASGNSGSLTLGSYSGTIMTWESSTDGGMTWTTTGNTTATENYTNLVDTTWYRVIVSSGVCGNDTSNVGTITVDPPSVGGLLAPNDTVCSASNNGTIFLNGITGSIMGWEYSTDGMNWIGLTNTADSLNYANLLQTTFYRAIVQSGVCASTYSSMDTITVTPPSNAGTITGAIPVCEGSGSGTLTLGAFTGSVLGWESSTDGGSTWTPIANTTSSQPYTNLSDTTWYRAIVANGACAADTSTAVMVVTYPKPVAGFTVPDACLGASSAFTNTTTVAAGGIQFNNWDLGDNNNSIATNPIHEYAAADTFIVTLIATSNFGCSDTLQDTAIVHALPSSSITAGAAAPFCSGDSVQLTVTMDTLHTYLWNTGDTTNTIMADSTGNYVVTVTDTATGCVSMDSMMIDILPRPVASAGMNDTIGFGASVQLNGSGGDYYMWTPAVGLDSQTAEDPIATPPSTLTYTLQVTGINGCSDTDAVTITLEADFNLIISNLVTANGDGHNDNWIIKGIEYYPNNEVHIYNRNGMEVYSADGYHNEWNATWNGQRVPDGTYMYVIKFTDSDVVLKGAVTIVSEK